MENQQIARAILSAVGPENITEAYNCMTRLRLRVKAVTVTKEELKKIAGVKGVIMNEGEIHIVLGPGKAENVAKECKALLAAWGKNQPATNALATDLAKSRIGSEPSESVSAKRPSILTEEKQSKHKIGDGKELHAEIKKRNSESAVKRMLQRVGHIFIPLIPAFIGCGLLTGLISLLLKISPEMAGNSYVQYLKLAGGSIFTVLNAFIGLYACKEFGGTPALGGAMAALLAAPGGGAMAALLAAPGLADITFMGSPLIPGRGGIFASLLAGAATALIETRLRKRIPESASLFLTPLITITIVALAGLFIFQPLGGILSDVLGYYTVPCGYAGVHGHDDSASHCGHGRLRTGRGFLCRVSQKQKQISAADRSEFASRWYAGHRRTADLRCYLTSWQAVRLCLYRRRLRGRVAGISRNRFLCLGHFRDSTGGCYQQRMVVSDWCFYRVSGRFCCYLAGGV